MKNEKREHPRFEINQLVELNFGHEIFLKAEGVNISENGLLCNTNESCELDSRVYIILTIALSDAHPVLHSEGIIVRSKKHKEFWETGIRFTNMDDVSRQILASYIDTIN